MKRFLIPLLAFILGIVVMLPAVFTLHFRNEACHKIMLDLDREKMFLGHKICSLILEISPDLKDSGKGLLISRDGSVTVIEE